MCCPLVSPLDPAHSWCKRGVLYSPAKKASESVSAPRRWENLAARDKLTLGQILRLDLCCVSVADFVPALKDSCDRLIQDFR